MIKFLKQKVKHWHKITLLMLIYDFLAVNLSYFMGLWFRFDCQFSDIPEILLHDYALFAVFNGLLCLGLFLTMKLYNTIWRFASFTELIRTAVAVGIHTAVHSILFWVLFHWISVPYIVVGACLHLLFSLAIRFAYRFVLILKRSSRINQPSSKVKRVMLVGAGNAGQVILRDVNRQNNANMYICCIVDDNPNKWGRYIDGVLVAGGRHQIPEFVKQYQIDQIFIAIPSASSEQKRDILDICKETACQIKSLPGIEQLVTGQVTLGDMKQIAVEDLLGREPIKINMDEIYHYITGKTILVTGGGGSIGSELCRQIAGHDPKLLIIFDVYENNAYDIEQELRENYPELNLKVLIGSVRDSRRLTNLFATYRPDVVYHAAAHKHVPLMEASPCESIKNNVIGTYKTAYAAMIYGCKRFVLISTDKAVNPTNIMGASKRLCEMIIQSFDRAVKEGTAEHLPMLFTHQIDEQKGVPQAVISADFQTEFVAVRFGNVLGSNGSVIPLFKKQIAKGGPVKVTHPDIIRYFMTIPEAVSLVMQAGTYAKGGEIFILDMGVPVKIDTLARNLIKLSGYEPDVDIPIVYTGLRPGEKLYEEKLMDEEGMEKTPNSLIHIGSPIPFDTDQFLVDLERLMQAAYDNDTNITSMVANMVTTYHPEQVGTKNETFRKLHKEAVGMR